MQRYAIRHISGNYLTDQTKGGSWWEGEAEKGSPRLFKTEGVAKGWITSWLKGRVVKKYDPYGEYTELHHELQPLRQRSQLSVIPVTLTFGT